VEIAAGAAAQRAFENLFPPRMHPRRRERLMEAIGTGLAIPAAKHPEIIRQRFQRPTEAEFRRFRDFEKRRDAQAHKLDIDATLIASKATLGDLARDWEKHSPELMHWQRELMK
jgi:hypothetical protein